VPSAGEPSPGEPSPGGPGPAWWGDRVFYEVFVRSFADSNGDGIGDLRGLTQRLDYLNDGDPKTTTDLGVTGLWLMPVMESPSYHGYDVVDYRAIERDYGTADDFRDLIRAAHARGIAVIVDFPINHTSRDHPWFRDSRTPGSVHDDWYVWATQSPGGPGWHPDGDRWYYGFFWEGMPDLNLRNPKVTAELTDVARFWLRDLGVDGFRLDGAKHLIEDGPILENTPETHAWLGAFHAAVRAASPDALLVGEVWDISPISASYVPAALDMTFEFGLATAYQDAARNGQARSLDGSLREVAGLEAPAGFGAFLANHDMSRIASQLGGDRAKLRLAASLLLTGPGVPFVYYGEEIGMSGAKPDERIRTPMQWDATMPAGGFSPAKPWEPLSDDWRTANVAGETGDPGSLLSVYRSLVRLRGAHEALRNGAIVPVTADAEGVVATVRATATETLLVVANVSDTPIADYALDLAAGPLCGTPDAAILHGEGSPGAPVVTTSGGFTGYRPLQVLPPRSVTVIALRPRPGP
jgi:glycosidase